MPQGEDGVSDADVAAIFARLRAEVRQGAPPTAEGDSGNGTSTDVVPLPGRDEVERLWAVTAESGVARRPGLKGAIAYPVKRLLRPFLRWYVEPPLAEQRHFNLAALRLIDELTLRLHEAGVGSKSDRPEPPDER